MLLRRLMQTEDNDLLFVWCIALLSFCIAVNNGFVLDDIIHIEQNPYLGSLEALRRAWLEPIYPGNLYRPLSSSFNALLAFIFGRDPRAFLISNILLHGACAALVLRLFRQFIVGRSAFYAAALFASHPLHIEVVANSTGKAELLAAFFVLLSLLIALREETPPKLKVLTLFLSSFLAFCSKESALCLLLLLPLCQWFFKSKRPLFSLLISSMAAIAYLSLRHFTLQGPVSEGLKILFVDNPLIALSPHERIINAALLLGKYFSLAVIPYPLSADYSYAQLPLPLLSDWLILIYYACLLALLLILCIHGLSARKLAALWAAWFLLSFTVTSNILFPIGTIFAERLAYLPSIGACGLAILAIQKLIPDNIRSFFIFLLIASGAFYCLSGSRWWRSQESLYSRQIQVSPGSLKTLVNYAVIMRNQGDYVEAERKLLQALAVQPDFYEASFALAALYAWVKDFEKAERYLKRTLELNPHHFSALELAGRLSFNSGDFKQARIYIDHALEIQPDHTGSLTALVAIELSNAELESASEHLRRLAKHTDVNPQELQMLVREYNKLLIEQQSAPPEMSSLKE